MTTLYERATKDCTENGPRLQRALSDLSISQTAYRKVVRENKQLRAAAEPGLRDLPPKLRRFSGQLIDAPLVQRHVPCVYFLIRQNTVVYVGQSCNLRKRLADHTRAYDRVLYIPIPKMQLLDVEGAFYSLLKPFGCMARPISDADRDDLLTAIAHNGFVEDLD